MRGLIEIVGVAAFCAAGLIPAGATAGGCTLSSQCDDGDLCNGREICGLLGGGPVGACFPGTPPSCDDGIPCTLDDCDASLQACVHAAPDFDGDGVRDARCVDASGMPLGKDCDDEDADRFPGNVEVCDAEDRDEDCDSDTFGIRDLDGDGFPDASCCNLTGFAPDGLGGFEPVFACGSDCADANPDIHPQVPEVCNGFDDNCRDGIDEGLRVELFADLDGDGHGDPSDAALECPGAEGLTALPNDCDDSNPAIRPGTIVCDANGPAGVLVCDSAGGWVPAACDGASGQTCVPQPNGTGVCAVPASSPLGDLDADGYTDATDNCPLVHNPGQADADSNGFGDACECGDVNGDGRANTLDARAIQRLTVGQLEVSQLVCGSRP